MAEDHRPVQHDVPQTYYDQATEIRLLIDVIQRLQNRTVIDVGAEKGSFTRALLGAGAESVYAFEPFPANVQALRNAFVGQSEVRIFDLALGAREETRLLHVVEDKTHQIDDAYHTLVAFSETPMLRIVGEIPIQCRTLDALVAEAQLPPRVGILKIDTERSDLAVLQGMGRLYADVVMLEYWDDLPETVGPAPYRVDEVAALMAARGYANFVAIKRFDQFETLQMNVAQTRPGDWGNLLFVHDTAFPELGGLIYDTVAQAQTELVDRAIYFAGEAETRLALIEQGQVSAAEIREAHERLTADLVEKEYIIVELSATADDRLQVIEQAVADARRAHAAYHELTGALQERERLIAELTATTDERGQLLEQATVELTQLRSVHADFTVHLERLMAQLHEKDRAIADVTAAAEERGRLLEQLTAQLHEKDRAIADVTAAAEERGRLLEQLTAQLHEKDRAITDVTAAAEERGRLLERVTAQLREKERAIVNPATSPDRVLPPEHAGA